MYIPSYQMHNVLNIYSRQLSRSINSKNEKIAVKNPPEDQVNLTSEGKRLATIEKVTKAIYDKITRFGSLNEICRPPTGQADAKTDGSAETGKNGETTFVFNVIDNINEKRTTTVSVKDSSFLIHRQEQDSAKTGGKKTESWI